MARVLSAIGGALTVGIGITHAVAYTVALDRGLTIATTATLYALPAAMLSCLLGGFAQLPKSWLPLVIPIVAGAPLVGWLSLQSDVWQIRLATAVVAALAAASCGLAFWRIGSRGVRPKRSGISRLLALGSLTTVGSILIYAVFVAVTPASWWQDFASPHLLAYGYAGATVAATIAGLVYRPSEHPGHG
ncbi:hypothetical protein QVA66_01670 [Staphylococcus chromogenes]|nr:hypothetical protein [Staphylococcus chromogenes]